MPAEPQLLKAWYSQKFWPNVTKLVDNGRFLSLPLYVTYDNSGKYLRKVVIKLIKWHCDLNLPETDFYDYMFSPSNHSIK